MSENINDMTGFMNGNLFESDVEVSAYFTIENIDNMFGKCNLNQKTLDIFAELVIANKWHMKT